MAADLPFYKTDSASPGRRPRTNKRFLLVLAVLGMLFLLFLNGRISSSSTDTLKQSKESDVPSTPAPTYSKQDLPTPQEESDVFPIIEDISDENEESEIIDEFPTEIEEPTVDSNAASPHSDHHSALPHPLEEETGDDVVLNESGHYQYLVVIASEADQMSRRNLIREKYFGLRDNLLPCMQYNTDTYYKFWVYGGAPKSDTPERRQYEAEKMEWNDIEELPHGVKFEQESVIEWAETTLAEQGITYDYLIVQDIYTFMRLNTIKSELDTGVISENTNSPVTVNQNAPTNFVWGLFSGHEIDKHAFVIGSAAAKLALEKRADIHKYNATGTHLLTNMYGYFNSIASSVEKAVDASLEPEEAAEVQEQEIPTFVREDGPEDTHRFIRWENNVESVHTEDSVVTHVYQDAEFAELARWTYLKPVMVCHTRKSAFKAGQPPINPLDDDEETSDLVDPEQANSTLPESKLKADGPSIALVTSSYIYDYCMEPSATRAAANKRKYALRHGHSFVARSAEFVQQRGRKTVWGKIDAVEKVLPKYDWIFWMDMDAVIMNQERSLFELLDDIRNRFPGGTESFDLNIDLIASRPRRDPMVNAGVFFLRNSPWSMRFLRDLQGVTEWYNKGSAYEQGAMWDLMQLPENQDHIFLLDRDDHTFNTFPKYYEPGDFIVHFAPDKCPNAAVIKGLDAADRIEQGEVITSLDEE